MKQEAMVTQFENDNESYNNIRKASEEKVADTLAGRKELLVRAVLCVIESIRKDPDKYGPLIYHNDENEVSIPSTISPIAAYYNRSSYTYSEAQQRQQNYFTKDPFKQSYIDMLREESEKLFTSLEKMLVDEVIDQYTSRTSPSSLPFIPLDDNQQQGSSNS